MTRAELIAQLVEEVSIAALTNPTDYENACDDASRDTGWAYPVAEGFKTLWQKERAKRYLFFYLASQSAHKFKIKQISLKDRFDNYLKLIKFMDAAFKEIQEERPDEFAGVNPFHMFGTKIDAGFATDPLGRDITYDVNQEVISSPDETS